MRSSDAALRVVALAIAIALFVVVRGERRVTVSFAVPVAPRLPPALAVTSPLPAEVSVTLSGPWSRLRGLEGADLGPAVIDLSRAGPGTVAWVVRPEGLYAPRGVRVESIYPAQGTIVLAHPEGAQPSASGQPGDLAGAPVR
jgi:YbbR domain-containing protein